MLAETRESSQKPQSLFILEIWRSLFSLPRGARRCDVVHDDVEILIIIIALTLKRECFIYKLSFIIKHILRDAR